MAKRRAQKNVCWKLQESGLLGVAATITNNKKIAQNIYVNKISHKMGWWS